MIPNQLIPNSYIQYTSKIPVNDLSRYGKFKEGVLSTSMVINSPYTDLDFRLVDGKIKNTEYGLELGVYKYSKSGRRVILSLDDYASMLESAKMEYAELSFKYVPLTHAALSAIQASTPIHPGKYQAVSRNGDGAILLFHGSVEFISASSKMIGSLLSLEINSPKRAKLASLVMKEHIRPGLDLYYVPRGKKITFSTPKLSSEDDLVLIFSHGDVQLI